MASKQIRLKPALLIVDVQNEFFRTNPETSQSLESAIPHINRAIELFRETHLPVVCIQHLEEARGLVPGKDGFDLPQSLNVLPSDLHIHKTRGNAFFGTPLAERLRELGVNTAVIAGYSAEYCVLSTYRGAEDLDLTPMMLRGSLAVWNGVRENIGFVERISNCISTNTLRKILE